MFRRFFPVLLLSLFIIPHNSANAEKTVEYQEKLNDIREKITDVLTTLNTTQSRRSDLRDDLQKLEIKIAKVAKSLREIRRKHRNSKRKLTTLKKDLKRLKINLKNQRTILSSQLRTAHAIGTQPQLKLLLNQKKPAEIGRSMVYLRYLNNARTEEITTFLSSITKKKKLESSIKTTTTELEGLISNKNKQRKTLSNSRASRKRILVQLNKDIDEQKLTLDDLKNSRNRIEQLLMSLGEILADIPATYETVQPFKQRKGKLPWPVRGKFGAEFGTSRSQGDLTWSGVIINTAYGTPVRSISHGRVVFSDWLQGYGFITIIDHNDGYMSLYGHNQALYKQAGEWVEASEVIATIGDSGGQTHSGLYFELRYQGKPINPRSWCSSKNKHLALKD